MEPSSESISLIETVQRLYDVRLMATRLINEVGRLADLCSGEDGNGGSGTHGLQMSYDRLIEARAWIEEAAKEMKGTPMFPQQESRG